MPGDLNQCNFIGNLGGDPEVKNISESFVVCNFNIAVSQKWKGKDGTPSEHTEWVRCAAFGKAAEIIGQCAKKGSKMFVSGEMQTRKWEDNEGNTRYSTEIKVRDFQFLSGKNGDSKAAPNDAPAQKSFDDDVPF